MSLLLAKGRTLLSSNLLTMSLSNLSLAGNHRNVTVNALTLISGAGAAQLIALIAFPILTRLYTPETFGMFAVYSAILSLGTVMVCLRFELAVLLPKTGAVALIVIRLCLFATLLTSFLLLMLLTFGEQTLRKLYTISSSDANWFWLIALSLAFAGIHKAATFWHTREKNYRRIAYTKFNQSALQSAVQLLLGFTPLGIFGLILGEIIGKAGAAATLWFNNSGLMAVKQSITNKRLKIVAANFKHLPMLSSGSVIINQLGFIAPALVIAAYFGVEVAGWFAVAQRVLAVPMDLFGQSISSLYIAEASSVWRKTPEKMAPLYLNFIRKMFVLGAVAVFVIVIIGQWLFLTILGDDWTEAALYAKVLVFGFWFRFSVVPFSQTLTIIGRADIQLCWDIARLVLVVVGFWLVWQFSLTPLSALTIYTGTVIVVQLTHAALTLQQLRNLSR